MTCNPFAKCVSFCSVCHSAQLGLQPSHVFDAVLLRKESSEAKECDLLIM